MATIQKRGNSYLIRVSCGYSAEGRHIMKSMTWKPDEGMTPAKRKKELDRQATIFEEKVKSGQVLKGNVKFSEFADSFMKDFAEKQLSPKTVERYYALLDRINPAIGHIRLDRLTPVQLNAFYSNLAEKGIREDVKYTAKDFPKLMKDNNIKRTKLSELSGVSTTTISAASKGNTISAASAEALCKALDIRLSDAFTAHDNSRGLSTKTILHHHRLISSILNRAVRLQLIFSNPAERADIPKAERKEAEYLDEKQAAHLIELLQSEPIEYRTMIILLIYSGLRRGELLGLEWKDIDFDNSLISVCRSSQYLPDRGIFTKGTKTESSVRTIKLSNIAFDLLKEYRAWQTSQRLKLGDAWEDNDRLFTQWNGKPLHPDSLTGWFENFIKRTDLPKVHIHSLRHTNATLMIAAGTDVETISKRLGHAQTSTTTNIYGHAIQSADAAAADTLQDLLNPVGKGKKA